MRLIPLAILCALVGVTCWIGATVYTDKIEQDIATRTNEAVETFQPAVAVAVDGRDVTLSGRVRDENSRADALQTADSVWGVRATRDSLSIMDAYSVYGKYNKGGQLNIDGTVDHDGVGSLVQQTVAPIEASTRFNATARPLPDGDAKMALAAGAVSMLNHGEMWIDEEQLKVTGEAEDAARKAQIEDFLNSQQDIIDPLRLIADISAPAAPQAVADVVTSHVDSRCYALNNNADVVETILFDIDSSIVKDMYTGQLQNIIDLVRTCGSNVDGNVIVEAHADQDGSEDYNYALSQRRADQVTTRLVSQGLDSRHIASFAYGETRPVASNEVVREKSYNRRVEVRFIPNVEQTTPVSHTILSTEISE